MFFRFDDENTHDPESVNQTPAETQPVESVAQDPAPVTHVPDPVSTNPSPRSTQESALVPRNVPPVSQNAPADRYAVETYLPQDDDPASMRSPMLSADYLNELSDFLPDRGAPVGVRIEPDFMDTIIIRADRSIATNDLIDPDDVIEGEIVGTHDDISQSADIGDFRTNTYQSARTDSTTEARVSDAYKSFEAHPKAMVIETAKLTPPDQVSESDESPLSEDTAPLYAPTGNLATFDSQDADSEPELTIEARLSAAILKHPNAPINYILRGEEHFKDGNRDAAAEDFAEALTLAKQQAATADWDYISETILERARQGLRRCGYTLSD